MSTLNTYQSIPLSLGAGGEVTIDVSGRYVACLESSLSFFNLAVDNGAKQRMERGLQLFTEEGEHFTSLTVANPDLGNPLTVRLAVGSGEVRDNRFSAGAFNLARQSDFITPAKVDLAGNTEVTIYTPDGFDQEVRLRADPLNLREVYLKKNPGGGFNDNRYPLWPGEQISLRLRPGASSFQAKNPLTQGALTIYILQLGGAE